MHSTYLRKVGGSVMLAVPPALLDLLDLSVGTRVDIGIEGHRLVVAPTARPRYTLDELLAQCDEMPPFPPKTAPGSMRSRSAMSCCSGTRRHLACQPRPHRRP